MRESPKKRAVTRLPFVWNAIQERHKHVVVGRVNDHEIKIAVNEDASEWHSHPNSDEFFLTLEGSLVVEFRGGGTVTLNVGDGMVVESGAVHRTIPSGRTVNLLVEHADVTTMIAGGDGKSRKGSGASPR